MTIEPGEVVRDSATMKEAGQETLAEWLERIERLHAQEIELGLARISRVAEKLPLSPIANTVITVAGTNGKGSTIRVLEQILLSAGLKVGCYTSPHLRRYNERVTVNDEMVSDEALCGAFRRVDQARGKVPLTYFEFGTLAAFDLFARANLDVALLEVGLGGRLDATNIIDGDVAIISSIALDHENWLGDNRDAIGFEKAGIMRAGSPVICGDFDPPYALLHHAESLAVNLDCQGQQFGFECKTDDSGIPRNWNWWGHRRGEKVSFEGLPIPEVPLVNAATAIQALMQLGLPIQKHHLVAGLEKARLAGRYQRVDGPVPIILDVAHNPHAAVYLAGKLAEESVSGRIYALVGMLQDKDCEGIISALEQQVDHWSVCDLATDRAMRAEQIAATMAGVGIQPDLFGDVQTALKALLTRLTKQDLLLVFGSFYTVSEALEALNLD